MLEHGNRYRTQESEYNALLMFVLAMLALYVTIPSTFIILAPLYALPMGAVFGAIYGVLRLLGVAVDQASDIATMLAWVLSLPYAIWATIRVQFPMYLAAFKISALIIKNQFTFSAAWALVRAVATNAASDWGRLRNAFKRPNNSQSNIR